MAVVSNPLIGNAKQSMGGATFSKWKGVQVLKNKATSVANPRTDPQLMQRSAMRQTVLIFRLISEVIKLGYKKGAAHMSEFNRFTSVILKNAFDFSGSPVALLVPDDILISKGTISPTTITSTVADRSDNTITVNYTNSITGPGQSATDKSLVAAYNTDKEEWTADATAYMRTDASAVIPLPVGWDAGDEVIVYLGFYNALSGESSDSTNTSTTIVA